MRERDNSLSRQKELTPRDKVVFLRQHLGETVTNHSLRNGKLERGNIAKTTKRITQIMKGEEPDEFTRERINFVYDIFFGLLEVDEPDVVTAWFYGQNPELDDRSPDVMLEEDPEAVKKAAQAFIFSG